MKKPLTFLVLWPCLLLVLAMEFACNPGAEAGRKISAESLFVFEIQPLFEAKCLNCHGHHPDELEGGFDLRSAETAFSGGNSGLPAIVPGKPGKSALFHAVVYEDPDLAMPPKETDRLSEAEVDIVRQWITAGAAWPDSLRRAELLAENNWSYGSRMPVSTSGGLSDTWTNRRYDVDDLWAFLPLQSPEVPWEALPEGKGNPIDAFIEEQLRAKNLTSAPEADKRTLLRRATFDLTGLPPTPDEIADFLADDSPDAFEKVINRLLASPGYGEQWGRHWLDVVRYADSGGGSNDYIRPNAWRYRDYVIRSFNEDKPYDQFILEQIAGDEIDPSASEMLIAAGFLRMGPWEHTGMSVAAETRQFFLDDVTNSVGETFLSTPLSCAKCHDHKFDPIPTRDYYRIQAVFAPTQFAEREAPFLPAENRSLSSIQQERIEAWIDKTLEEEQAMRAKEEQAARQWFREKGLPYLSKKDRRKLPDDQQPPRYYGLTHQDLGYRKVLQKRRQILHHYRDRFEPLAYSVYNGPTRVAHSGRSLRVPQDLSGDIQPTAVLTGGSVYSPADPVRPGILSAVTSLSTALDDSSPTSQEYQIPNTPGGRRLAFARWLTDPEHPITSRSIVNRIWQYHFGKGIAENPNNFGATGKRPTHPELLDWLAGYFIREGWSVKALHQLIMNSKAYRRSGNHPNREKLDRLDPDNGLLARFSPRRLEAEEVRDAMLFLSGELNSEMGGLPIRPEVNQEVALQPRHIMGSISMAYQPSRTPEERNRRSIYAERYRGMADPFLEVFNQPATELSCEGRTASNVTPQAFTLFNSARSRNRSLAMAYRLSKEADGPEAQIRLASQLIWNREASRADITESMAYYEKMLTYHQENKPEVEVYPASITRRMFEEMTGEAFEYTEELDIFQDYVPDLKPSDVPPETRALADLALVLFNTNEFLYVY